MDFDFLLNAVLLLWGLYSLYTALKLCISKALFKSALLIPNGRKPSDCLDEPGYIAYISPRLLVISIFTTAGGVFYLLNDLLPQPLLVYPLTLLPAGAVLAALIWYAVVSGKANRIYFGL